MNNNPLQPATLIDSLRLLGLSREEARVYLELVRAPSSHLQVSRLTGINRTKVYRLVEALEKKSLVTRRTDDRGTFLVASDISGLEVGLIEQEERVKEKRFMLQEVVADVAVLKSQDQTSFFTQTYEGAAGFKQMCWHELQAVGEVLSFGNGTIEEEGEDNSWADRHRQKQVERGYHTKEITNYDYGTNGTATFTSEVLIRAGLYEHRKLSPEVLTFDGQTIIYNNTVAIYHWKHGRKVGTEIINGGYADMFRQIFYNYWNIAR